MVNSGADLVADTVIRQAVERGTNVYGWTPFANFSAQSIKYNTGSYVDMDGFSALAGLSWSNLAEGGPLTIGAFFEGGHGGYDTYNSFAALPSVKGDGDVDYYGGGLLARLDFAGGFHAEASARAGRVESDFNSSDLTAIFGQRAAYDSKTSYYGGHLGLGYAFQATERVSVDLSSKYLWTHQGSDRLDIAGQTVEFDSVNSNRWRNGFKVACESDSGLKPYAGAAFEYEISGRARSRAADVDLQAPSLRGGTGIGEIGLIYSRPDSGGFFVDAGLQGYTGQREGVSGRVQFGWSF